MKIELPDLTSGRFKANPYPFYARLRAEAPVLRIRWLFGIPAWLVTRYDDVLVVLKDDRFSKHYVPSIGFMPRKLRELTRNLLNVDPPDHTRLRTLVNKAFTPRVVEKLRSPIEKLTNDLLDRAATRGGMELISAFALPIPLAVIADLMGIPDEDRGQFAKWSKRVAAGDSGSIPGAISAWYGMWRFGSYFKKLIEVRRREPRDDIVTALVEAEEEGDRLNEQELVAMLALLLFAGYETTVHLIGTSALVLMQNDEERERLRSDPAVAATAIEELLRYTSPADFATPRVAREDIELGGAIIPRGALVLPALGSANRDETQFAEPDRLDLARDPNRHLAFGMGAHYCVGAPLARLEAQIALTALFRRFPRLQPAMTADALPWRRGMLFRGLESLPVRL